MPETKLTFWTAPEVEGVSARLPGGEIRRHLTDKQVAEIVRKWLEDRQARAEWDQNVRTAGYNRKRIQGGT